MHNIISETESRPLSVDEIIHQVSQFYQLTPEDIKGKKRTKHIVFPRQIAMYLARELTDLSFPKIGEGFGNKNHTTVIHAYDKISDQLTYDIQLQQEVEQLTGRLKY